MRRIRYIETTDPNFRTREGLRVGATLGEVLAAGGDVVAAGAKPGGVDDNVLRQGLHASSVCSRGRLGPSPVSSGLRPPIPASNSADKYDAANEDNKAQRS